MEPQEPTNHEPELEDAELDEEAELVEPLGTVYVLFSAEINVHTTESFLAAMANLVNQGVEDVVLLLSTPGGDVMNGISRYNVLRAMPFHLVTHNVGNVDSIGNVLFLASCRGAVEREFGRLKHEWGLGPILVPLAA